MSKYNYLFKIVIIGDHNCGKSCILLRFAESSFRDDHITTIGVDFKVSRAVVHSDNLCYCGCTYLIDPVLFLQLKTIKLDKDKIRLELWDTAGE